MNVNINQPDSSGKTPLIPAVWNSDLILRRVFHLYALLLLSYTTVAAQDSSNYLFDEGAKVEKLSEGFAFTEGPVADRRGNVYFTDQPNNRIHIWTTKGELKTFLDTSGRANGLFFDRNGHLLSCSDEHNQLWSINNDKSHKILVRDYKGKLLNGPNDLWVHPDGGVYFTDPLYPRDYWTRSNAMQQDGQHVYFLSPDRKTLTRVISDMKQPNGIIGTPDGKRLYVADIGAGKTYAYRINPDNTLSDKQVFALMGSDGMTIDERGNVYLTGRGITVFNPKGEKIAHIDVDAKWTANVCFGGHDRKTLFITASQYLYSLRMKVKGVK